MESLDITEDAIFGGHVRVRQPARGYRVNVDTLLLAAANMDVGEGARVAEPCCGVGAALLALARQVEGEFVGIERDPAYAALARENVALNRLSGVSIVEADALDPALDVGTFDAVLLNPPYDDSGAGQAPSPARRAAFVAERPVEAWIKVWSNRLRASASFTMIHRAHKLADILKALDGRLGGVQAFPVFPHAGGAASRVIVRARKGSRAPLSLERGLVLHPDAADGGKYTPQADAILRGGETIRFR